MKKKMTKTSLSLVVLVLCLSCFHSALASTHAEDVSAIQKASQAFSEAAYLRLLREMHKVLNKEVGASHAYGDIVSLDTLAPKDAIEQAESMVGEEFYEFYQPDELLKIEDLIVDEKALMSLENGQDDQKISYLLGLLKELPIKWRRAFMLHELENIPVNKLAGLMDINTDKIIEWIDYTNNYLNARLLDAGFEAGIGSMLSDLRSNDR